MNSPWVWREAGVFFATVVVTGIQLVYVHCDNDNRDGKMVKLTKPIPRSAPI